jgi:hypothetical protein
MATDWHRLALERRLGSEEGEAFDRRLRETERAEREERLAWSGDAWGEPVAAFSGTLELHAALAAEAPPAAATGAPDDDPLAADRPAAAAASPRPPRLPLPRFVLPTLPADLIEPGRRAPALDELQLRREVERLSHFHDSVQRSRAWRLTQGLRRLVGRAW